MSKKIKNIKPSKATKTDNKKPAGKDLFERLDLFFDSKGMLFLWVSLAFTLLFSFLLFNARVSEGGDDSAYILRAYEFVKQGIFPTYQGPLYSLVLSFFVWIFGLNVVILKLLSILFIILHLFFFYKAFYNRIPGLLIGFVLIIIAFNAALIYYASQTYNEAFFMMLQAIFFYFFFTYIIDQDKKASIYIYILLGLFVFLIGITKTIGYSILFPVLLFLLINRNWKGSFFTLLSFVAFYFFLSFIKSNLFGIQEGQFESQLGTLLQVDPYDKTKGLETFSGYINRFWGNSNLYLSKHLYGFIGLKTNLTKTSVFLTILTYLLFILAAVTTIRKNKYLLFTGFYLASIIGATFVMLQTRWDQDRLILVFFPLILVFIFSGVYYLGKENKFKWIQGLLPVLFIILFFTNLKVTVQKVKENDDLLMNTLAGNELYGLTPDWVNYIKISQWAAKNIPENEVIACRKPSISFIYGKRSFFGIYRIPTTDADTLLNDLKANNVQYVIMGSLRRNPKQKTEYTINTVQRYLYYIQTKYPQAIQMVQQIGLDEPAYLFKIDYDKAKPYK